MSRNSLKLLKIKKMPSKQRKPLPWYINATDIY